MKRAFLQAASAKGDSQDDVIRAVQDTVFERLENKIDIMQLRKDEQLISDGAYLALNNSATAYCDVPQVNYL